MFTLFCYLKSKFLGHKSGFSSVDGFSCDRFGLRCDRFGLPAISLSISRALLGKPSIDIWYKNRVKL